MIDDNGFCGSWSFTWPWYVVAHRWVGNESHVWPENRRFIGPRAVQRAEAWVSEGECL